MSGGWWQPSGCWWQRWELSGSRRWRRWQVWQRPWWQCQHINSARASKLCARTSKLCARANPNFARALNYSNFARAHPNFARAWPIPRAPNICKHLAIKTYKVMRGYFLYNLNSIVYKRICAKTFCEALKIAMFVAAFHRLWSRQERLASFSGTT